MVSVRSENVIASQEAYVGIYLPSEVSSYLLATLPTRQHPPTSRSIMRWIRSGLVAPERGGATGRKTVIDFEDLVTCQAIALLREAGLSLQEIRTAERYFGNRYRTAKPFARHRFWVSGTDLLGRVDGLLVLGSRGGQIALDLLVTWLNPLKVGLGFSEQTDRVERWLPMPRIRLQPNVQFGQPCVDGTRIPTGAIWGYVRAGDPARFVAESYGLTLDDVERAVEWEERRRTALAASATIRA